jgi:osmotically-inducible protein OsmY
MADRYDEDRWPSRGATGWDDNRGDDRARDRDRGERIYNRDRSERGPISRGADEVRSWFGDDEAQRRREMDEQRDRLREPRGGRPDAAWDSGGREGYYERGYGRDHTWSGRDESTRMYTGGSTAPAYADRGRWSGRDRGYFDSSMGYASESSPSGNLNPFVYRGPGSYAGRGPKNYQRSDERIREDVISRLTDDHRVDASDVDVRVQNGEVTLGGQVQDRRMRRAAEECVEDLPGVRDVHNELRVQGGRGALGEPGAQQERDDITTLNLSGTQAREPRK